MKSKVDKLISESKKKDLDLSLLQTTITTHENTIQNLKDKLKELEDELLKLNVSYYPKLKEVEGLQKGLLEEFFKVKKEIDVVSTSLENDNELKNRLQNDLKEEKELVESIVGILGRERRKIHDLKEENKKLDKLVLELTNKHFPN